MRDAGTWIRHLSIAVAALSALSSCGPQRNAFAPACPAPLLPLQLSDLTRYRAGAGATGKDLSELELQGRLTAINGDCSAGSKGQLNSTIQITMEMTRGPALAGRRAEVQVFVAVSADSTIIDKQTYPVLVEFPANLDRVTLTSPPIDITLPVTAERTGAAYDIIAGFQLSPDELAANRRRQGR